MSAVPGSLFRRVLFWAHLSCGVLAGVLILVMSVTGTLLTYERQMIAGKVAGNRVELAQATPLLAADQLATLAQAAFAPDARISLVFDADLAMPVTASQGRESMLLHPQTGAVLPDSSAGTRAVFQTIKEWHRRLGGESRSARANLMDLANLMFLFIIASGIYLWLPAVWRWRTLRGLMLFRTRYVNGKVRDFNWHHVLGFWMLIPLFLIALSGVVISYSWAGNLVYAVYGEKAPQRGGGGGGGGGESAGAPRGNDADAVPGLRASHEQLLTAARSQFTGWQKITLPLDTAGSTIEITAELESRELRAPRQTLTLSTLDASVVKLSPRPQSAASTQSPGQRARSWLRFVHTGEQYGVIGQTLAGLASLAACFLVYTGLALAWRRLIRPLF